jgi:hypothetical protein
MELGQWGLAATPAPITFRGVVMGRGAPVDSESVTRSAETRLRSERKSRGGNETCRFGRLGDPSFGRPSDASGELVRVDEVARAEAAEHLL